MQVVGRTIVTRTALACAVVATLACGAPRAAAQLRIVTYNTATGQADNPTTGQTARPGISTILAAIGAEVFGSSLDRQFAKPIDVLLLQEQYSMAVTTQSFVNVLNSIYGAGVYARGNLTGATSDPSAEAGRPGLVYNTQTVQLLEETAFGNVGTSDGTSSPAQQPRSTLRYKLKPVGYDDSAIFYAYNSHYKSDTGTGNNNRRLVEAQAIRTNVDALGQGTHALFAGDYNIQTSSGTAYQHLLSAGNGQAFDPVNRPGSWHDNSSFADLFTQAPATVSQYSGQTLGGMDDRFDFQLVTGEMLDDQGMSYIAGSYHAFGNNGSVACCNSPITDSTALTPEIRTALMQSSDHLPVVADYALPAKLGVQVAAIPSFVELGSTVAIDVTVSNTAPAVNAIGVDELAYTLGVTGSLSGSAMGTDAALGGSNLHQVLLNTSTLGLHNGAINVLATSAQTASPMFSLPVSFQVIAAFLAADFNKDGSVDATDLTAWRSGFGIATAALKAQGDADNDGDVDGLDLLAWQRQLGQSPAALAAQSSVPEPANASLAAVAALLVTGAARRRSHRATQQRPPL